MHLLNKETSKGLIKLSFKLQFDTIINWVIFRQSISSRLVFRSLEQENLFYPSVKQSHRGWEQRCDYKLVPCTYQSRALATSPGLNLGDRKCLHPQSRRDCSSRVAAVSIQRLQVQEFILALKALSPRHMSLPITLASNLQEMQHFVEWWT